MLEQKQPCLLTHYLRKQQAVNDWAPAAHRPNWIIKLSVTFSRFLRLAICPDVMMIYLFCFRERWELPPSASSDVAASPHTVFLQVSARFLVQMCALCINMHMLCLHLCLYVHLECAHGAVLCILLDLCVAATMWRCRRWRRQPVELKVNKAKMSVAAAPHNNHHKNNNNNQGNNNLSAHLDINTNHSHLEDNNNNQAHLECRFSTEAFTAFGVGWCLT